MITHLMNCMKAATATEPSRDMQKTALSEPGWVLLAMKHTLGT